MKTKTTNNNSSGTVLWTRHGLASAKQAMRFFVAEYNHDHADKMKSRRWDNAQTVGGTWLKAVCVEFSKNPTFRRYEITASWPLGGERP